MNSPTRHLGRPPSVPTAKETVCETATTVGTPVGVGIVCD